MPLTISNPMLLAVALAVGWAMPAVAQKYTPEPPPLTTAPCKPTKKSPCPTTVDAAPAPANPFPFPGEEAPAATPAPAASQTPAVAPGSFPFPGEPAAEAPAAPIAGSSSSSSSEPAADPDQPALKDEGSTGSTRFARKKLPKVDAMAPDEREAEDVQVSRYYFSTGNFTAAYLRAKDATKLASDDPSAFLALGAAAVRVNKPEEAEAAYTACLKLDSSEQQIKTAKKGLADIAAAKPVKQAAR